MHHDGKLKEEGSGLSRRHFLKAAGFSLAVSFATGSQLINGGGKGIILIRNGQIIDGTGRAPLQNGFMLIQNGRIKEIKEGNIRVPPGARIIDATGKTVLPGLFDMHAHLASGGFDTVTEEYLTFRLPDQLKALKQMLYWGVTGVCDPVQPLDFGVGLRAQTSRNGAAFPRLFITGPGFTSPGGWAGTLIASGRFEPKNPGEVKQQMAQLAAARVDFVKLFYDDMTSAFVTPVSTLDKSVMESVIAEAHAHRLKVMVHAYATENHKAVIRAGADIMAHSAITEPVDDEYLRLARKSKTLYLATLSVYHDVFNGEVVRDLSAMEMVQRTVPRKTLDTLTSKEPLDSFERSIRQENIKHLLPTIDANLKKLSDNGIPIGVGPDTGVFGAFPGFAAHREMELMVNAGVPADRVLVGATKTAAEYMRQPLLGTIERGKIADLLIVDGDPLKNIKDTRNISVLIKDGGIVNREKLLEEIMGAA